MNSFIVVRGNGRTVKVTAENDGTVSEDTLRGAFQLEHDVPIGLYRNEIALKRRRESNDYVFELKSEWIEAEFELSWDEARRSRPVIPIASTLHPKPSSKRQRIGDEQPVNIQDLNDSQTEYILKLEKFIFYSILMKTECGSFENVNNIRSCVTVAKKEYAVTAAHCLPDGVPEGFEFEIFNHDEKPLLVQLKYINKANDFAVLKTVKEPFENYPKGLAYPDAGIEYTLLGYHGNNYQPTTFLSAFFDHIRNNRHSANLKYVLGSPGTTRGCSGSGVFNGLALIGIVVSGRLPPRNVYSNHMSLADHVAEACTELAEPSYNLIVPCAWIISIFEEHHNDQKGQQRWRKYCESRYTDFKRIVERNKELAERDRKLAAKEKELRDRPVIYETIYKEAEPKVIYRDVPVPAPSAPAPTPYRNPIAGAIDGVAGGVANVGGGVVGCVSNVGRGLVGGLENVGRGVAGLAKGDVAGLGTGVIDGVGSVGMGLVKGVESVGQGVVGGAESLIRGVGDLLNF